MHTWEFIEKFEDGTSLRMLKVPSGYLYHYIRKGTIRDIGGNVRTETSYEQIVHGSMDHSDGKTDCRSLRWLYRESQSITLDLSPSRSFNKERIL